MRRNFMLGLIVGLVGCAVVLLIASTALANSQHPALDSISSYDLSWYTIDGGGQRGSTSAHYELGGTIGQPDAGLMLSTDYALGGGFWIGAPSLYRVYLPLALKNH